MAELGNGLFGERVQPTSRYVAFDLAIPELSFILVEALPEFPEVFGGELSYRAFELVDSAHRAKSTIAALRCQ